MRRGGGAGGRGGRRCRCSTRITRCGSGSCWGLRMIRAVCWGGGWCSGGGRWRGCRRSWGCRLTGGGRRGRGTGGGRGGSGGAGVSGAGGWGLGWGGGVHAGLAAVARECRATLFMVVQAALAVLLSRVGAGTDIPLGSPVAGRTDVALDELVGFFVNTLVLRTDVSGDPGFGELVERVREADLAAFEHQDVPFERLVEVLAPARSMARHPLFQVQLALGNNVAARFGLPGAEAELVPVDTSTAKFDLTWWLGEVGGDDGSPGGLRGSLEFAGGLFDRVTAEGLAARFVRVLEGVAADPGVRVSEVEVLTGAERELLAEWNQTGAPVPAGTLPELFEAQVARTPDAVAGVFEGTELSYAQLDERADQLARCLIGLGAGPERFVALALPRSELLVVALLGVLKAGAGYLPVDPEYPAERIKVMLDDARPVCLITVSAVAAGLPDCAVATLALDQAAGLLAAASPAHPCGADRARAPL